MRCESDLKALLRKYISTGDARMDSAAIDCATEIFRAFYTAYRVWLIDTVDEDFAQDVTRSFINLAFGLSLNPFWKANAAYLQPILSNAMVTWTQSAKYLERALQDQHRKPSEEVANDRMQALVTQSAFVEIIMAVASLTMPHDVDKLVQLRDELTRFKEAHLFEV